MHVNFCLVLFALAFVFAVICSCNAAGAEILQDDNKAPQIPVQDFFRNPDTASYAISPDGSKLAFAKPWERRMNVYVRDIASGEERRVTSASERDIAGFFWKGSDRIVYAQDNQGDENFHVYIVNINNVNEARDLTPFEKVRAGVLDDLEEEPKSYAYRDE